jgi:hypothetical protein
LRQAAADLALSRCHHHSSIHAAATAMPLTGCAPTPRFTLPPPPLTLPPPPCRRQAIGDSQLCFLRFDGIVEVHTTMCLLDEGDHRSP